MTVGGVTQAPLTTPLVFEMRSVTSVTAGELIGNEMEFEVCPPLDTVMAGVPAEAIRLAFTEALKWVEDKNVVGRLVPFHR